MIGLSIISAWFRAAVPSLTPLIYGLFGMAIIAPVLTIVGKLLCLTASSQMPGKGSLVLALVFDGIAFLITLVRHGGYYTIAHLIGAAGSVCFLVFLKKLGESLRLEHLTERATAVLYLGNMYIALWIVQFGLANGFMFKQVPLIVVTIGMNLLDYLLFVIGLVGAASYAGLLSKYRRALSNR